MTNDGNQVNENQIGNSIKSKIHRGIEYKGFKKTDRYFIKDYHTLIRLFKNVIFEK